MHLEIKLHNASGTDRELIAYLDPEHSQTKVVIRNRDRRPVEFKPLVEYSFVAKPTVLPVERPSKWQDVNLHFGTDGFTFSEPGTYEVQAQLNTPGGMLVSNVLTIWISYPDQQTQRDIVPTFDSAIGTYLAVEGGQPGGKAEQLLDEFSHSPTGSNHPLKYHYLANKSLRSARGFKQLNVSSRRVDLLIPQQPDEELLLAALGLNTRSKKQTVPDLPYGNILLGRLGGILAQVQRRTNKRTKAERLLGRLIDRFKSHGMPEWKIADYRVLDGLNSRTSLIPRSYCSAQVRH